MDTIKKISFEECVGCGSCKNICPIGCIEMKLNEEGFLFPKINSDLCIKCGKCLVACPANVQPERKRIRKIYGGYSLEQNITLNSSSGGVFWHLASNMIEKGGVVFGASIDVSTGHVYHKHVKSTGDLDSVMRSKYVQSEIGNVYSEVREYLKDGIPVLFCGTPCQVAGLKAFLREENYQGELIVVEFICHGVPSPGVWEEYISYLNSIGISPVRSINFRDKRQGWHNFGLSIKYGNDIISDRFYGIRSDDFYNGFIENLFLRKSCYQCKFKGMESTADISLADFWNCENRNVSEKLNKNQFEGISLIVVFSDKGEDYLKKCSSKLFLEQVNDIKSITTNVAQIRPAELNKKRSAFFQMRKKSGTVKALRRYGRYTFKKKVFNKLKWKIWDVLGWYH